MFWHYQAFCDLEMLMPVVFAWVKKTNHNIIVVQNSAEVGAFARVADRTGISKIFKGVFTAVFDADDVLNLKFDHCCHFGQSTIFAFIIRSPGNFPPEVGRNVAAHSGRQFGQVF